MSEQDGLYRQAEHFYLEANKVKEVITMYHKVNKWEDCYRVAKARGGPKAALEIAFFWAYQIGGDSAAKLLTKLGLFDDVINYAINQEYVSMTVFTCLYSLCSLFGYFNFFIVFWPLIMFGISACAQFFQWSNYDVCDFVLTLTGSLRFSPFALPVVALSDIFLIFFIQASSFPTASVKHLCWLF